jgi:myo-inositol-1(or 4)-monophosphatase
MPAEAGIQKSPEELDPRLRGNDAKGHDDDRWHFETGSNHCHYTLRRPCFCCPDIPFRVKYGEMKIEDLREIGRRLMKEMPALKQSPDLRRPLGTGAAGDKTFPIDRRAEEIIIAGLDSCGEPCTVISEEAGFVDIKGGGLRVIIDPVDGSKNAIAGIPFFCTSIAVASGDTLESVFLSYIINLLTGDEFWAEKSSGAFMNGSRIAAQEDDLLYLVSYEAQIPSRDLPHILPLLSGARKTRCFGSTALDLAYLAAGAVSVFVCPAPSRSFDFAAGWLLAKEAGGIVTDTKGKEIPDVTLGLERASPLLASGNAVLHRKALGLLTVKKA